MGLAPYLSSLDCAHLKNIISLNTQELKSKK